MLIENGLHLQTLLNIGNSHDRMGDFPDGIPFVSRSEILLSRQSYQVGNVTIAPESIVSNVGDIDDGHSLEWVWPFQDTVSFNLGHFAVHPNDIAVRQSGPSKGYGILEGP